MKTFAFALFYSQIRKSLILVLLLMLPFFASTPSFASRHHQHIVPSPIPTVTDAAPVSTPVNFDKTSLYLSAMFTLILGLHAYQDRQKSKLRQRLEDDIDTLNHYAKVQGRTERLLNEKISELGGYRAKESKAAAAKDLELQGANENIKQLQTRIQGMLDVDPEIEQKAKEMRAARAQVHAEAKKKEEANRLQKRALIEGQVKLSELISNMKGGR